MESIFFFYTTVLPFKLLNLDIYLSYYIFCYSSLYFIRPTSVVFVATVIMRMVVVIVKYTVRDYDIQVIRLVIVMIVTLIVTLLFLLTMLPLLLPRWLSLLRKHQVCWILTLRMLLNRSLCILRRHHQER